MAFTPGPWEIQEIEEGALTICGPSGYLGREDDHRVIVDVNITGCGLKITDENAAEIGEEQKEDKANAHLIAAAPELYEACSFGHFDNLDGPGLLRHAAEYLEELGADNNTVLALRMKADLEEKALAKARGEVDHESR